MCCRFADAFGAGTVGQLTGMAHDLGKYSAAFQQRLYGGHKVDHATAGAIECLRRNHSHAAYCVIGHHSGLPDLGVKDEIGSGTFCGRINNGLNNGIEDYSAWKKEINLSSPPIPDICNNGPLSDAFFIRMLYSCLVDADFLDTETFMTNGAALRTSGSEIDTLDSRLNSYIAGWFPPKGELNEKRCQILSTCIECGETHQPGLFTLTVPTGGGKTVASLAFALRHAKNHNKRRIIYVIPYTSIIEQTAEVFRKILGVENVLEHHSGAMFDTADESTHTTLHMAKATENWDMPVVVTTAVQFFESLYSNRSSKCRKLHNLANSVIIFDEAQMMPLSYLRPCVHAIAQLIEHYQATAVLCTATQPALEPLFKEFLPQSNCIELCPEALQADPIFRRVQFRRAAYTQWDDLARELNYHQQVLCIVNSRANAQTIYSLLNNDGKYHLSTLMTPADRKSVLKEVRHRLSQGLPCRVISTSLIEAGVDVDFPLVYREEAGLDSVLQAAGRCNREGKRNREDSIAIVFSAPTKPPSLFATAIGAGRMIMDTYDDFASTSAIHGYFREYLLLKGRDAQDTHGILRQLDRGNFPFKTIAEQFKLIETDTKTIYIPVGEGEKLIARRRAGEVNRALMRQLGQYSISVYEQHFKALYAAGALESMDEESYVLVDKNLYNAQTGLSLTADAGKTEFV